MPKSKKTYNRGFSLMELMVGTAIMAFCLAGLLAAYISSLTLSGTARNFTLAINAAQAKLEELRNSGYDSVSQGFYLITDVPGFSAGSAVMRIDVDYNNYGTGGGSDDLILIRIVVCWREKGNRIIGEDNGGGGGIVLNGQLDGSEDVNNNNRLDSPVEVASSIGKFTN